MFRVDRILKPHHHSVTGTDALAAPCGRPTRQKYPKAVSVVHKDACQDVKMVSALVIGALYLNRSVYGILDRDARRNPM